LHRGIPRDRTVCKTARDRYEICRTAVRRTEEAEGEQLARRAIEGAAESDEGRQLEIAEATFEGGAGTSDRSLGFPRVVPDSIRAPDVPPRARPRETACGSRRARAHDSSVGACGEHGGADVLGGIAVRSTSTKARSAFCRSMTPTARQRATSRSRSASCARSVRTAGARKNPQGSQAPAGGALNPTSADGIGDRGSVELTGSGDYVGG
jgi:hypothetical protein